MTTPGQLPIVTEDTAFRAKLKLTTLWAIGSMLVAGFVAAMGAGIWLYILYADVQTLKEELKDAKRVSVESQAATAAAFAKQAEALGVIRDSVKEIEWRQKFGSVTTVPSSTLRQP